MRLKKWIEINKWTYEEFGNRIGKLLGRHIGSGSVFRWAHHQAIPKLDVLKAIQTLTYGRVALNDFLEKNEDNTIQLKREDHGGKNETSQEEQKSREGHA